VRFDYEHVTYTHCQVAHFIPSISACIGDRAPQRYIWRILITLMLAQRSCDGFIYDSLFPRWLRDRELRGQGPPLLEQGAGRTNSAASSVDRRRPPAPDFSVRACTILFEFEQFGLLLLTMVSSSEALIIHQAGFAIFFLCGIAHQWIFLWLYRRCHGPFSLAGTRQAGVACSRTAATSAGMAHAACFAGRLASAKVNSVVAVLALFAYAAHEAACIPFAYSVFATCEWTFVISNICFHHFCLGDLRGARYAILSAGPSP
jgi:hypothetical protein